MTFPTFEEMQFQFTPLVRGATVITLSYVTSVSFNSRPSCEGRPPSTRFVGCRMFQFTPLVRGATVTRFDAFAMICFNSRPSCEGRPPIQRPCRS